MADEKPKSATGPKVSPARTIASLILLLIVGVICAIELRAGFGQRMSGNSLAANSNDGEFKDLTLEDARGMMSLSPSETSENRGPDTYYHFEWYSLLRPLMGQASPKLTIVATNEEKPMALAFFAADETESVSRSAPSAEEASSGNEHGAPGMGMGPGGPGMGMGRGPGGDGKNKRPPMEDEAAASESSSPAEAPAPTDNSTPSETPAVETPVGDAPAAEEPAPAK